MPASNTFNTARGDILLFSVELFLRYSRYLQTVVVTGG